MAAGDNEPAVYLCLCAAGLEEEAIEVRGGLICMRSASQHTSIHIIIHTHDGLRARAPFFATPFLSMQTRAPIASSDSRTALRRTRLLLLQEERSSRGRGSWARSL